MAQDGAWSIFYGDNTEFSSKDGTPWDAPRQDVQVVVQADAWNGWIILHGQDYFYYEAERGGWSCGDVHAMHDHLVRANRPLILFGRLIADAVWTKYIKDITDRFGEKSGKYPRENL